MIESPRILLDLSGRSKTFGGHARLVTSTGRACFVPRIVPQLLVIVQILVAVTRSTSRSNTAPPFRRQRAAIKARLHRASGDRLKPQRPHHTLCFHNGCLRVWV